MSQSSKLSTVNSKLNSNGGTMTGALTYNTTTGNNPILITSSLTSANNAIQFINNNSKTAYIGLGGTAMNGGGYYCSNLYLESTASYGGIIFNTGGNVGTNVPRMIITSNGNVGIGITNPSSTLYVNGTSILNGATTVNGTLVVNGNIQVTGLVYNPNPNYTGTMTYNATTYFGNAFCLNMYSILEGNQNNDNTNIYKLVIYDNNGNYWYGMIGFSNTYPQAGTIFASGTRANNVTIGVGCSYDGSGTVWLYAVNIPSTYTVYYKLT
jgi:hypothetical protein